MKNIASIVIGIGIIIAVILVGYWFWVPDVGALKTWNDFLTLPIMRCTIGDASVKGLTGDMYVGKGRLRADYKVEGDGMTAAFHTIVYEDGTAYTWAPPGSPVMSKRSATIVSTLPSADRACTPCPDVQTGVPFCRREATAVVAATRSRTIR